MIKNIFITLLLVVATRSYPRTDVGDSQIQISGSQIDEIDELKINISSLWNEINILKEWTQQHQEVDHYHKYHHDGDHHLQHHHHHNDNDTHSQELDTHRDNLGNESSGIEHHHDDYHFHHRDHVHEQDSKHTHDMGHRHTDDSHEVGHRHDGHGHGSQAHHSHEEHNSEEVQSTGSSVPSQ